MQGPHAITQPARRAARRLPVDYVGAGVTILGVVIMGCLALARPDIGQSAASIIQLILGAVAFLTAVFYLAGLIILEGWDEHGKPARLASETMLLLIPSLVAISVVLTLIRT